MDIQRYKKAIEKVIQNIAERGYSEVDYDDLWFEIGIPKDLIKEIFETTEVLIADEINKVTDGKRVVWEREGPKEK